MLLRVTFHLDGTGVVYDPNEPIHLDALLAWAMMPHHRTQREITRDDEPDRIPLPILAGRVNGVEVWRASALFPDSDIETLRYWRKRFRSARVELTTGSPNTTNGTYRDWQMPVHLTLCRQLVGWCEGNRREVLRQLRKVRNLGKKRAHGHGKVVSVEVERTDEDYCWSRDGLATRWLPDERGSRMVRPIPPYWNRVGRVRCCEVGDRLG